MFSKKATKIDEIVFSNSQIDGEDFVNFCGLLRKRELYVKFYYKEQTIQILNK